MEQLIQRKLIDITLVSMTHFNAKAMPTNDNKYSCHSNIAEFV